MNSTEAFSLNLSFNAQPNLFEIEETESKLARAIESHTHRIQTIEKASGPSRRTQFLREEIARLQIELEVEQGH